MYKFIWPIAFIIAFAVPMYARAQQQDYTFKITGPEIDVIAKGLETQPYKDVVPLLQKLREQFAAQQKQPEPVPVPKPAPEPKE